MKKIITVLILSSTLTSIYGQTSMNLSTPNSWNSFGSNMTTTTISNFYGHANWMQLNSVSSGKIYEFKRVFYVCRAGKYTIKGTGMGNNHMTLYVNASFGTSIFDRNNTDASQFNTPSTFNQEVELKCGRNEIIVHLKDDGDGNCGFYLDFTISSRDGKLSEKECQCEVYQEVCRCPKDWYVNTTNELGGITPNWDKKCKKLSCKPMNVNPPFPNGTPLGPNGSLGFTWGDELWIFGTPANGGASNCKWEWLPPSTTTKPGEGRGR